MGDIAGSGLEGSNHDPRALRALQPYLETGETLRWTAHGALDWRSGEFLKKLLFELAIGTIFLLIVLIPLTLAYPLTPFLYIAFVLVVIFIAILDESHRMKRSYYGISDHRILLKRKGRKEPLYSIPAKMLDGIHLEPTYDGRGNIFVNTAALMPLRSDLAKDSFAYMFGPSRIIIFNHIPHGQYVETLLRQLRQSAN